MKKVFIGLLLFTSLQIVCSQDTIYSSGISRPAHFWSFGVQLGGSSLLTSPAHYELSLFYYGSPQEHPNYDKQIRMGWYLNGTVHYMISSHIGLGINYSFYAFSPHNNFLMRGFDDHVYLYMEMGQKQYIHCLGPSVIFRQWLNKDQKLELTEMLSVCYVHYQDKLRVDSYVNPYFPHLRTLVKGSTWGANTCLSLNYYPIPWLSVGVNAGFTYTRLNKVDITSRNAWPRTKTIELDHQLLSLLNYSLSVRFHIF